jgi:hypothetical protein
VGAVATGFAGFAVTNSSERMAAIIGVSAILAATALGLAIIVRADVQARATASAAQYEARARVTDAFLSRSHPVATPRYFVTRAADKGRWTEVVGFTVESGEQGPYLAARTLSGDHIRGNEIAGITTVDATP